MVTSRSPVAIGIVVWREIVAIASTFSGGHGSSNHSGSLDSSLRAIRIAPLGVNWPWVPNSRSARSPTAARSAFTNASDRASSASEG